MQNYFVLVLTPTAGQWTGHSRDFPHIEIRGRSAESTYIETSFAVRREIHRLRAAGLPLPVFRTYAQVRIDDDFARERRIQWPHAIVRMASLPAALATMSAPQPAGTAAEAEAHVEPLTRAG